MIKKISITNFKDIKEENIDIRKLTLLMGGNSTGKSTCLQAILDALYYSSSEARTILQDYDFSFDAMANKYENAKEYRVLIEDENGNEIDCKDTKEGEKYCMNGTELELEKNVFYLGANRLGYSKFERVSKDWHVGTQGEYIFGDFHKNKSTPIAEGLRILPDSDTLSAHLDYWLSKILKTPFRMDTIDVTNTDVAVSYKADQISSLSPAQLGVGVSYVAKVILMCLRANPGDVLLIENPEIHLHPAAQAALGEFLVYVVNAGIQLVIETHCDHLINMIRYKVYDGKLSNEDVVIYYKENIQNPFVKIELDKNGRYLEEIPAGFFDATLSEMMQIQ